MNNGIKETHTDICDEYESHKESTTDKLSGIDSNLVNTLTELQRIKPRFSDLVKRFNEEASQHEGSRMDTLFNASCNLDKAINSYQSKLNIIRQTLANLTEVISNSNLHGTNSFESDTYDHSWNYLCDEIHSLPNKPFDIPAPDDESEGETEKSLREEINKITDGMADLLKNESIKIVKILNTHLDTKKAHIDRLGSAVNEFCDNQTAHFGRLITGISSAGVDTLNDLIAGFNGSSDGVSASSNEVTPKNQQHLSMPVLVARHIAV